MLEISKFSWSNFLSFGDYVSTVDLSGINECLITGTIEDDNGNIIEGKSNGAGKSNVIAALQWTLFGRTPHSSNPGDKIRNWKSKADTWGKIVLENGDSILRTRKADGAMEVVFYHAGQEECVVADTLSTLSAQQAKLSQAFNLDWDMFSKSVFFSCFDKPWMQMSDQKRKETLEKLLKIDRLSYYAKSAANRAGSETIVLEKEKEAIVSRIRFLKDLQTQMQTQNEAIEQFETNRMARINQKINQRDQIQASLNACTPYDIPAIQAEWNEYNTFKTNVTQKVNQITTKRNEIANNLNYSIRRMNDLQREIQAWNNKLGTICKECGQEVTEGHVHKQSGPKEIESTELNGKLPGLQAQVAQMDDITAKANQTIQDKSPVITVEYARSQENLRTNYESQIITINSEIEQIKQEIPPNNNSMEGVKKSMMEIAKEVKVHQARVAEIEVRIVHLDYIRKAYSDRNKIKRDIVGQHVPFLNERLRHYLEIMELEVKIQFNDNLGVESNCWGYEWQSNGEKRRSDVAMMFATFDFHEQLYGRQCNILTLDEVDGQMDSQGINSLIHIIKSDLAKRAGSIFIISHRNTMQSVFGSEINVRKRGKLSYLEQ